MSNFNDWQDLARELIKTASEMTGNAALDDIRSSKAAQWVRDFKIRFPLASMFIERIITDEPTETLSTLRQWFPEYGTVADKLILDFLIILKNKLASF